jgi:hypothetical protein
MALVKFFVLLGVEPALLAMASDAILEIPVGRSSRMARDSIRVNVGDTCLLNEFIANGKLEKVARLVPFLPSGAETICRDASKAAQR